MRPQPFCDSQLEQLLILQCCDETCPHPAPLQCEAFPATKRQIWNSRQSKTYDPPHGFLKSMISQHCTIQPCHFRFHKLPPRRQSKAYQLPFLRLPSVNHRRTLTQGYLPGLIWNSFLNRRKAEDTECFLFCLFSRAGHVQLQDTTEERPAARQVTNVKGERAAEWTMSRHTFRRNQKNVNAQAAHSLRDTDSLKACCIGERQELARTLPLLKSSDDRHPSKTSTSKPWT